MARVEKREIQREIELKFDMRDKQLKQLRRRAILRDLSVSKPVVRKLKSIYFDDPDLSLYQAGVSLRLRTSSDGWIQTLKWNRKSGSGLFDAHEFETEVPHKKMDIRLLTSKEIPAEIINLLSHARLAPVFQTQISRSARFVRCHDGSEIEVAFDSGRVGNDESSIQFEELELELKSGHVSGLFSFARHLIGNEFVLLSRHSKAERGYALLANGMSSHPIRRAQNSRFLPLEKTNSAELSVQKPLFVYAEQIIHNLERVLTSHDPEGPHQLRIALRRLRSTIQGLEPVFVSDGKAQDFKRIARHARKLGRLVGALRDADVLDIDIARVATKGAPTQSIEIETGQISDALIKHRADVRQSVIRQLSSNQTSRFLLDLLEQLTLLSPSENDNGSPKLVKDVANEALQKSWEKVKKRGRRLNRLSVSERHNMRKDLKVHRYQVEFFASLFPKDHVRPYFKTLKRLQSVFGYLNDASLAEQLQSVPKLKALSDRGVQQGVGYIIGWHEARAETTWPSAHDQWKQLCAIKQFWDAP